MIIHVVLCKPQSLPNFLTPGCTRDAANECYVEEDGGLK